MRQHVVGHARKVPFGFPAPLLAGAGVVQRIGPALGDLLLHGIDVVVHREGGQTLFDLGADDLGREAHRREVEAVAVDQFRRVGLHQFDAGAQGVGHVDHVHVDVRRNGTGEFAAPDRLVVNLHGVVGRTAAGQRDARYDARETHRTGVDAVFVVVVVPEQFARDLADAVDRRWLHDRVLRGFVLGRRRPEGADRRGGEQRAMVLPGHFERIVERPHVDVPGHLRVTFAHSREQSDQVEDRINMVTRHDRSHCRRIERIEHFERAGLAEGLAFAHVCRHDIVVTVNFAQIDCQLGTNLASGTYY